MKIIVLATEKGGAGKTTLCINLACAAIADGLESVYLVDCDPQGSLAGWWNGREGVELPHFLNTKIHDLPKQLLELKSSGVELVVIDTPGFLNEDLLKLIKLADLVIIPTRPSQFDLEGAAKTSEIVKGLQRRFFFVINQAIAKTNLVPESIALISEYGAASSVIVSMLTVYQASLAIGRSVVEFKPKSKAADEMRNLWVYAKARLNGSKGDR